MNKQAVAMMVVWIFILVAGGLILALFFFIGDAQAQSARDEISLKAMQRLESIIATQQASDNTFAVIDVPREQILFTCEYFDSPEGVNSELRIGGVPREKTHALIAGRDMLTDELIVFSHRAMVPFSAGNILMIGHDQEALVIDGLSDDQLDSFKQWLPPPIAENMVYDITASLDASQLQTVRAVRFEQNHPGTTDPTISFGLTSPQDALFIHVEMDPFLQQGIVRYWTGTVWSRGFHYYGTPMLLAYIWLGDEGRADCFAYKIAQRISTLAELHAQRIAIIRQDLQDAAAQRQSACVPRYFLTHLEALRDDLAFQSGYDRLHLLSDLAENVRVQNERLIREDRCATIY